MLVAIVTALLAVLVFVLTQSFLTFVLEPIPVVLRQRSPLGQLWPPDERQREVLDEARLTLRGLAGRLRTSLWTVPFYDTLARLGWVPKREDVLEASTQLVGWSNSLYGSARHDARDKRRTIIADRLGITKLLEAP